MKESHLTLRLAADVARALARLARERGLSKSHLAREAVAHYLAPPATGVGRRVTAGELAGRWALLPHLDPEEAGTLADEIAAARAELPPVRAPWE